MSDNVFAKTMAERNRLIEQTSKEILRTRADELDRYAKKLFIEFEAKRNEILSELAKIEAGENDGL